MENTWPTVRLQLDSLRQELLVLRAEMRATPDEARKMQLYAWGQECVREFKATLQQYCDQIARQQERRGEGGDRGAGEGVGA